MQKGIVRTYLVFHSDYTPAWQEAVEVTKALILQLKKEVEANGSRLMVVLIPKAEQVHENGWVETLEEYPEMKKKTWDLEKPNRLLTKFLDQNNIKILDLLPPMRRLAKTERNMFYIGNRGHWNAEGHRLAAQLLYDYLINHKHVLIED